MPVISLFFGIVIRMFFDDHPPPHFHASYQGFEALVRIHDGEVMQGSLPTKARRIATMGAGPSGRAHGKLAAGRRSGTAGDDRGSRFG